MRLILRDRLSAGAIAGMIAFMLVFQALLSGFASGAMAASAADPLGVICTIEGMGPAGGDKQPARSPADCPCGTLCQLAVATTPGLPGGQLAFILERPEAAGTVIAEQSLPAPQGQRGLIAEARAPPSFSV
ncbi:DUF2946 family protein [Aminobacter sp. MDW-2]|uniref:DUF2946 family protein n=1 Tax=Aminobacter sp. MDW-2 TaxID=2666139 RepID=UPI001310E08B|nr:DUF2946 family protein [Aminobacter sp. MDW-2]MRX33431.1 hypothetical protein [Aminobacter sp. MDW-2]QNH33511.1 hypothetical protein H5P29_23880 [Aminobacter sp. MDW-2]